MRSAVISGLAAVLCAGCNSGSAEDAKKNMEEGKQALEKGLTDWKGGKKPDVSVVPSEFVGGCELKDYQIGPIKQESNSDTMFVADVTFHAKCGSIPDETKTLHCHLSKHPDGKWYFNYE